MVGGGKVESQERGAGVGECEACRFWRGKSRESGVRSRERKKVKEPMLPRLFVSIPDYQLFFRAATSITIAAMTVV